MSAVAWAEWPDLEVPDGVELLSTPVDELSADDLARIEFYVVPYMTGRRGLDPSAAMPQLDVLQVPNAGFDDALDYVRPGMTLCNASGVHNESTAELAVTLALASRRGIVQFAHAQREGRWAPARRASLTDAQIAVIGNGEIGRTISRMLSGFDVTVTPFSRRGTGAARPVSELPDAIGGFDIVILVMPLTSETRQLFDAAMLSRMRDGALLVNVARGGVVDTDALVAELRTGRLHAALDVTDPEPLPGDHPLWREPQCVITPHVGGNSAAFEPRIRRLITAQLQRWVTGQPLANVVMTGE